MIIISTNASREMTRKETLDTFGSELSHLILIGLGSNKYTCPEVEDIPPPLKFLQQRKLVELSFQDKKDSGDTTGNLTAKLTSAGVALYEKVVDFYIANKPR